MNYENISKEVFVNMLSSEKIITADTLSILQVIYNSNNKEASTKEISEILNLSGAGAVTGKIVGLGKRLLKKHEITQRVKEDGTLVYWDIFFEGRYISNYFFYKLKPELAAALESLNLTEISFLSENRNTFLFAWNPHNWNWDTIEEDIKKIADGKRLIDRWSCASHKKIKQGDRAFLLQLGKEPRGLFSSGIVVSNPYLSEHWSDSKKQVHYVDIEFDTLLNPEKDKIFRLQELEERLPAQKWSNRSSGVTINPGVLRELEKYWFEFKNSDSHRFDLFNVKNDSETSFLEGKANRVFQTRYERDNGARKICLDHYGYKCKVCDFDFLETYGLIGFKFIHVHHLIEVSNNGVRQTNPIKDLRPVCPNCHAMLHKKNPCYTIEELKIMIQGKTDSGEMQNG